MAVTAKDLKEYLRLPPDDYKLTGDASIVIDTFAAAVTESGTYTFTKGDDGWILNGSAVDLSEYGITADVAETEITVDYLTINVDTYLNAAKSKAKAAGIREYTNNAQYDLFIMALAAMYYDNRGMTFQNSADAANAQRMIDSFVLELRYAEDGDGI
ncbi:MAG: head-tail connector protein [Bacteroidales bacterium]|nr:head-tail connector protein [Bacteroidales bacterium]